MDELDAARTERKRLLAEDIRQAALAFNRAVHAGADEGLEVEIDITDVNTMDFGKLTGISVIVRTQI